MAHNQLISPAKPDADNIAKIILDSLNKIVFLDDVQVVSLFVIKKFGLNVDIPRYIQKANCYIYMHWIMRERRSWNYKRGAKNPLRSSKLMGMMPDNFKAKSDQIIPESIRKALLNYYP